MGDGRQFGDRLQHTGLVVCCHDRHQHGVRRQRLCERGRVDLAVPVNRQIPHLDPVQPLQRAARLQNSGMLAGLGDDPRRRATVMGEYGATDGEVVGLGSARGEHHLSWLGADQACELLAGLGQRAVGPLGIGVAAGRIAEMSGQVRQRSLGHAGIDRCGGVVVEIDGPVGQPWVMTGYARVVHAGALIVTASEAGMPSPQRPPPPGRMARSG